MKIGIVGAGQDKFVLKTENQAKHCIAIIMADNPNATFVSGDSPVGGIDAWTREIATFLNREFEGKTPEINPALGHPSWDYGYGFMARNIDIAKSNIVYVIVVREYPPTFPEHKKESLCYHCKDRREWHVKSGGCWTGWKAIELGNKAEWILL